MTGTYFINFKIFLILQGQQFWREEKSWSHLLQYITGTLYVIGLWKNESKVNYDSIWVQYNNNDLLIFFNNNNNATRRNTRNNEKSESSVGIPNVYVTVGILEVIGKSHKGKQK